MELCRIEIRSQVSFYHGLSVSNCLDSTRSSEQPWSAPEPLRSWVSRAYTTLPRTSQGKVAMDTRAGCQALAHQADHALKSWASWLVGMWQLSAFRDRPTREVKYM